MKEMHVNKIFRFTSVLVVVFMISSCTEENGNSDDPEQAVDSLIVQETTRGMESSAMRPELLGTWKLVDMRMDNEPLPQTIPGNSFLEFLATGDVALVSEGFASDTANILQNGDMLSSDIWDSEQRIDSLDMNRLILSEMLDGTEISYIYERQ